MPETLQESSKLSQVNTLEVLNELTKNLQLKKEDMQHQVLLAETQLAQLRSKINQEKQEFDIWKRVETQKAQDSINNSINECMKKEHAMNVGLQDVERMKQDLVERIKQAGDIDAKRKELDEQRISIHSLKVDAENLMQEAQNKYKQASEELNAISFRKEELNKKENELNARNISISNREDDIKKKEDFILKQIENLNELKAIVDPKIIENKEIEKQIYGKNKELEDRKSELLKIQEENKSMYRAADERIKKADERDRELDMKEEELRRKSNLRTINK